MHESVLEHYYRFAMLNICLRKLEWPQSQLTMQRLQLSTVFLLDPGIHRLEWKIKCTDNSGFCCDNVEAVTSVIML